MMMIMESVLRQSDVRDVPVPCVAGRHNKRGLKWGEREGGRNWEGLKDSGGAASCTIHNPWESGGVLGSGQVSENWTQWETLTLGEKRVLVVSCRVVWQPFCYYYCFAAEYWHPDMHFFPCHIPSSSSSSSPINLS